MAAKYLYGGFWMVAGIAGAVVFGRAKFADAAAVSALRERGLRVEAQFNDLKCGSNIPSGTGGIKTTSCSIEMRVDTADVQVAPRRVGIPSRTAYCRTGPAFHMDKATYPLIVDPKHPDAFVWDGPCADNPSTSDAIATVLMFLGLAAIGAAATYLARGKPRKRRK